RAELPLEEVVSGVRVAGDQGASPLDRVVHDLRHLLLLDLAAALLEFQEIARRSGRRGRLLLLDERTEIDALGRDVVALGPDAQTDLRTIQLLLQLFAGDLPVFQFA